MIRKLLPAAIAALGLTAAPAAHAVLIDLFSVDQVETQDGTNTVDDGQWSTSTSGDGSIVGGVREIYVDRVGGSAVQGDGVGSHSGVAIVEGGLFSFSTATSVNAYASVRWDGVDNGSGNADDVSFGSNARDFGLGLSVNASDSILIDVVAADLGFKFSIAFYVDALTSSIVTLTSSGTAGLRTIPIAAFLAATGDYDDPFNPGPDLNVHVENNGFTFASLASIGAIEATINPGGGTTSLDMSIASTSVVPEPAMLSLVAMGLFGIGASMRRRSGGK